MLGRRQIRENVLQALYAYNKSKSLSAVEKNMLQSMEDIYDLYIYQLNLLLAIKEVAEKTFENRKQKKFATDEEKNPNEKFLNSPVLKLIEESKERTQYTEKHKELSWHLNDNYPTNIFKKLEASSLYKKYLESNTTFEDEVSFIKKIFLKYVVDNQGVSEWFEDIKFKLGWVDGLHVSNSMVLKTIKSIGESKNLELIGIFKDELDRQFAIDLLNKTATNYDKFLDTIEAKSKNWKLDRIAEIDKIILSMGLCELEYFMEIPTRVIINEYIELAKVFSTENSNVFINGILDKQAKETDRN